MAGLCVIAAKTHKRRIHSAITEKDDESGWAVIVEQVLKWVNKLSNNEMTIGKEKEQNNLSISCQRNVIYAIHCYGGGT